MASHYTATDPLAYERLMGRWSGRLADKLIAFAGIEAGDRVPDDRERMGGARHRRVIVHEVPCGVAERTAFSTVGCNPSPPASA
jgi:hypothetical protein